MRNNTTRKAGLVALGLLLRRANGAMAQMGTGRVSGTVKDQEGSPIEGATVTANAGDSGRLLEATTDVRGRWAILGFRSRAYDFSVQAPGFMPYNYQAPMRQAGKNPDMDLDPRASPDGPVSRNGWGPYCGGSGTPPGRAVRRSARDVRRGAQQPIRRCTRST